MNQRVLLGPIAALTLLTTPALAQSDLFEFGGHFGGVVAEPDDRWHGGVQVALGLNQRFDFYTGVTVRSTATTQTLVALRAWPFGRREQRFAAWYLGAGITADGGVEGAFLTGVQTGSGRMRPFIEAQLLSPAELDVRVGFSIRVR